MQRQVLTFLFTDLEGSTRLWEKFPEAMHGVMARHDALLRAAVEQYDGMIVKTTGDGLHAAFESASAAAAAALDAQRMLGEDGWPEPVGAVRVRMGLHTGEGQARDGDYYGPSLNRAARIMAAGHGGQVLVSGVTSGLIADSLPGDVILQDLGEHSLRDLARPERIYQLCYPGMPAEFPPLKTLAVFKHNLPLQLTSFIGREEELKQVKDRLAGTRLLTLLGPGGTGKTRLMLQAAADLLEDFPDGVWLVELAPLADPELIPDQAASVLGAGQQPGVPLMDLLVGHLRRKKLLLLLDNVEHLVTKSAAFAEHLLQACPDIKILVTGRESLFIDGETTVQIPSLRVPSVSDPENLQHSEAVQLFMARARSVRPDFDLDETSGPAVAEIVRRLDGIPMALELAAARVRAMSVQQIAERLNDRFRLLTGGRRTAVPRQQTLQALIEWSWNLLEQDEQVLLRRLSVFSGGWTLEAAEEVAGFDGLFVLDLLDALVGKSLAIAEPGSKGNLRYRMLESIHQFAQDRLVEVGEAEELRNRHMTYFKEFILRARPELRGDRMLSMLDRVLPELENFRSARDWSFEAGPEIALELTVTLDISTRLWLGAPEIQRWLEEVVRTTREFVAASDHRRLQEHFARSLIYLGTARFALGDWSDDSPLFEGCEMARTLGLNRELVFGLSMVMVRAAFSGDLSTAYQTSTEAVDIARRENFELELVMALGSLTPVYAFEGDMEGAILKTQEAIQLARQTGNPWAEAMAGHEQARIAVALEKWDEAVTYYQSAAEKFHAVHDEGFVIICRSDMAHVLRRQGRVDEAKEIYMQTIQQWADVQHVSAVAHQLESFSYLELLASNYSRAAVLLGAADRLREEASAVRFIPVEIAEYQQALEEIERQLGHENLLKAMDEGRGLTMDQAVDLARSGRH